MQVEEVCYDFERDGIYVTIINKCAFVVCHYCPEKLKVAINQIKNNLRGNVSKHITSVGHKSNCTQGRFMTNMRHSVVDMRQEDAHYCLADKDLAVIGAYIKETAAAFALEEGTVQPALKKDKGQKPSTKRKISASSLPTVKDVEATSGTVTNTTISGSGRHITKNPKYHH